LKEAMPCLREAFMRLKEAMPCLREAFMRLKEAITCLHQWHVLHCLKLSSI